jgi:serine/threonine protein kinase
MNSQTPVKSESPASLVHILDDYLAALQEGRAVGEDELLARHPEHAGDLKECLASLEFIRRAHVKPHEVQGESAPLTNPVVGTLGDFRLIREIGRGGMGVVYEAEQLSLGRLVALKVLPFAATLDPKQLQRFKNEAQAAAHLHHTNIVPVHAVGCERGVHYYAMQYIAGRTLVAMILDLRRQAGKESPGAPAPVPAGPAPSTRRAAAATTERPDPGFFRTVARLGVQAAEALEHAHEVGILHRDIKPGNLLVDAAGHLWVTDFGLAQMPSDANLTMTGDLVGTLRYMSPEQTHGRRGLLDHRTDVYSLGVTLYELATLEPAFSGRDRPEVLRQITAEEPPAPRRVNPAVPVELETIILKAIDKAPGDRYQTARELAEDLGRFLKDEPIRGRRPTVLHQLRKWTRRNWGVVCTGAVAAALLLVTLAAGSFVAAWRLNEAWKAADDRAGELKRQAEQQADDLLRLNQATALVQSSRYFADSSLWADALGGLNRAVELRPELALMWYERGDFFIRLGLWDRSAADYAVAFRLQESVTPRHWWCYALLSRHFGDDATYQDLMKRLPLRFPADLPYSPFHNALVRACTLAPVPAYERAWLLDMADTILARCRPNEPWNLTAHALALYRAEDFQRAAAEAEEARRRYPRWLDSAGHNLVLAMAQQRLGKTAEARQTLGDVKSVFDKYWSVHLAAAAPGSFPVVWHDWLECHILYREAKLQIDGRPAPDDSRLWVARAKALKALALDKDAAECFARAEALARLEPAWPRAIKLRPTPTP